MTRKRILLCLLSTTLLALAGLLAQETSAEQTEIVPLSPSPEQVLLYLDPASSALDLFQELVFKEEPVAARAALGAYTQELSRFHVALGRLRIGKAEKEFVLALVECLKLQRTWLQSVSENEPSDWKSVSKEAMGHLESALQMANQKMGSNRLGGKLNFKRYGTGTAQTEQEKLKTGRNTFSWDGSLLEDLNRNGRSQ